MLNAWAQAAVVTNLLSSVSAANTAAATSAWVQASNKEGTVAVIVNVGAVTGSIVLTLEDATDSGGTGGAGFTATEGAFAAATANTQHKRTFPARTCRGWYRVVGTITTGPSLISAIAIAHPKNVEVFAENLSAFFSTADFAVSATLQGGAVVSVIFEEAYLEQLGIAGTRPVAVVQATLVLQTDVGKTLTIGSTVWTIKGRELLDDGALALLTLKV